MVEKIRARKKRSNNWIFGQSNGAGEKMPCEHIDYGVKRDYGIYEKGAREWIDRNFAYQMRLRAQDQDPTNVYGGMCD